MRGRRVNRRTPGTGGFGSPPPGLSFVEFVASCGDLEGALCGIVQGGLGNGGLQVFGQGGGEAVEIGTPAKDGF